MVQARKAVDHCFSVRLAYELKVKWGASQLIKPAGGLLIQGFLQAPVDERDHGWPCLLPYQRCALTGRNRLTDQLTGQLQLKLTDQAVD